MVAFEIILLSEKFSYFPPWGWATCTVSYPKGTIHLFKQLPEGGKDEDHVRIYPPWTRYLLGLLISLTKMCYAFEIKPAESPVHQLSGLLSSPTKCIHHYRPELIVNRNKQRKLCGLERPW